MLGKTIASLGLKPQAIPHYGVKEAVFPFNMFPEVDPVLGPEMRSTGEVLGMAESFGLAFFKAQEAAQQRLPETGGDFVSVSDPDKPGAVAVARRFAEMGFTIVATTGTHAFLKDHGIASERVMKLHEGRPNVVDRITNKEIALIINTPGGKREKHDDSYIRKAAIRFKLPYITTIAAAVAAARGIEAFRGGHGQLKSLQSYHQDLR
jgi:carbamoyl-phosphate synthase large subunit